MLKKKLILVFGLLLVLSGFRTLKAQVVVSSSFAIVLNEYSATNFSGVVDNYGLQSDWVELYCNHNFSVTLQGYYLSNDRANLKKWAFPSTFTMAPYSYKSVFLSGKQTVGTNYHANFTLDQCKSQWLILSTSAGVIRDSVFVQKTMANHTRGRVDYGNLGIGAWRLYTSNSFTLSNPIVAGSYYRDYAPTPSFTPATINNATVNAGGFYPPTNPINQVDIFLGGAADSASTCFEIHYTMDGSVPTMTDPVYSYTTGVGIIIVSTTMLRAIAFPSTLSAVPSCTTDYLPSFCQTNTYFIDQEHNSFSTEFGVVSIALDKADTGWFNSGGINPGPAIHVEYYDKQAQITEGYAQINRPPNEAWLTKQKGFFITIDDRRGFGCNFEGDIFNVAGLGTTPRRSFYTLHLKSGDYESFSSVPSPTTGGIAFGTGIRDVFYQSLAAKNNLHVSPLHIKPVVMFQNGKYQGVYDLRECYDKDYEQFYNHQSKDSLDMAFYHNNDGSVATFSNNFRTGVYDYIVNHTMKNVPFYNHLMSLLDKESFMDYMVLNSYAMNSDLWNFNVAFAKGNQTTKPGNKWHYYLWNTPAIFNFTAVATNTLAYAFPNTSPCIVHSSTYAVSPAAGNSHGMILRYLMDPYNGNGSFQLEYKNRYQDLLNGPLRCENILAHYDYVTNLFRKEMKYHGDPASTPYAGAFNTSDMDPIYMWDSLTSSLRRDIYKRCDFFNGGVNRGFNLVGCYGMQGPYQITIDVEPAGAGNVILNTLPLSNYKWTGNYYATASLPLKAIPSDSTFIFHHWEIKNHTPLNNTPLSMDSLSIAYNQSDDIIAVFTDKKNDIQMPTGFTPNGDGRNEEFKPLGSALYSKDYDFRIWNRWGQQVFRSTEPTVGWDGNYSGQQAITGVYAYLITYKNIYNEPKVLKGNVTLVR